MRAARFPIQRFWEDRRVESYEGPAGQLTGSVLEEVTADEYAEMADKKAPVFCRTSFLQLNKAKVDRVRYFLLRDRKRRLAFAVGQRDKRWLAPFSAPFSSVVELRADLETGYYWDFAQTLNDLAASEKIEQVSFFLPPDIYDAQKNAKLVNALLGNGYKIAYQELNYSLDLTDFDPDRYMAEIHYNARKNLRIALHSELSIVLCQTEEQKREAYEVIRQNRESKGYPLRMSLQQVLDTVAVVDHEFFLVRREERSIAAALVYHVVSDKVQVIYWGDLPGFGEYKPINFLSFELLKYYQEQGIREIDIGPSTEAGLPNFGLCSFKESIGCRVTGKLRLTKDFAAGG